MGKRNRSEIAPGAILLLALTGCSGGHGGPSTGQSFFSSTNLEVVGHTPADDELQVALSTPVMLRFDGIVAPDSLQQPTSGLFTEAGARVPGTFAVTDGGRTVTFAPQGGLQRNEHYTLRLSPLTCDTSGRLLDRDFAFTFHALDDRAPAVVAASLAPGQTGVSRSPAIQIDFDEALDPATVSGATVRLRDDLWRLCTLGLTLQGTRLHVAPVADLAGARHYSLEIAGGAFGVTDRAGNRLAAVWAVDFTTAADNTPPVVLAAWPDGQSGVSPEAQPRIHFSESIAPASFTSGAALLVDDMQQPIPFTAVASTDQRRYRIVPATRLVPGRGYTLTLLAGSAGVADSSGNHLAQQHVVTFDVGSDDTAPRVLATAPAHGASSVPVASDVTVTFAEPLDPATVTSTTALLESGGTAVPATLVLTADDTVLAITPAQALTAARAYTLTLRGGADGIRDVAGNPLAADKVVTFQTTSDGTLPSVLLLPNDGNGAVPTSAHVAAVFDGAMDPLTLDATRFSVVDGSGTPVSGTLTVERGDRVVRFRPTWPWQPGAWYHVTVRGGPLGVREQSGNWLAADITSSFRAAAAADAIPPAASVTLEQTHDLRNDGLSVPPDGFEITVTVSDPVNYSADVSSVDVVITGTGTVPGPEVVFAGATLDGSHLTYRVPAAWALQPGSYTLAATVRDLSGNTGTSGVLDFQVRTPDADATPFERTQVVWVRFDLDRDGNGTPDIENDLYRLGLATPGDPSGTNAYMQRVMRDGILARGHELLGRGPGGEPLGPDSVAVRLTDSLPLGLAHAQIVCAGLDPEGSTTRVYGSRSTGTLGRAWFDYRNGSFTDNDTGTRPGLGVFPGELFLFEALLQKQIAPAYQTSFGRAFGALCPDMGGTPAGAHPLDRTVLAPSFDPAQAAPAELARWNTVMSATDDWATAVGTILAHELGHSFGLVAQGPNPFGLHGDGSLHDEFATGTDIMAATLGYDSMIYLDYRYRDLETAYLRHRILLK